MHQDQVIAGIRLGKIIGAGATGVVHAGTVEATGQQVAVKLVRPQPGQPAKLVERTVQEGRVGWAVRHPNVVRVYEWGMAGGGAAYIVMERLEGETLSQRLLTRGRLEPWEAIRIARHIARGLAAIHAEGGVHRDVKPENVFLCTVPADTIKLLDLGIVHLGADHPARLVRTGVGLVVGTLGYLAPEQARGGEIDARSDLYGLGALLYHALTGEPPHPDGDVVDVLRHIALMTEAPALPPELPPELSDLVRWLLAPEPGDRPPDAGSVLNALELAQPSTPADRPKPEPTDEFLAMDEIADHQQIRAGIIAGVARAVREGGSQALEDDLVALDRLKERRRSAAARVRELRRQTSALAEELDGRKRTLEATRAELEQGQAEVRERYLQSTAALMEIADSIEDIDRRYLRQYETLDGLLSEENAEQPAAVSVPRCLAEMEALHQSRAFFADSQAQVRTRLRTQHRAVSGINLQVIEIKRELLAVEAERQATLVGLEDAQRTAEDEVLKLDREIEHQFLRLGFLVQAHQARKRMRRDAEAGPEDSVERGRRPRVVGKISRRRSIDARNAAQARDRRSIDAGPPRDRRSLDAGPPRDRRSVSDRRSQNMTPQRDRRAVADRRSQNVEPVREPRPSNRAATIDPDRTDEMDDLDSIDTNPRHRPEDQTSPEMQVPTDPRLAAAGDPVSDPGDDTAPQSPIDDGAESLPGADITSPERRPPSRLGDTQELVSPRIEPPVGALVRDRASRPPPLPDAVWTSASSPGRPAVADRRAVERVPCAVRVEVQTANERSLLTSRDLSDQGVYVFAPRVRPVGTAAEVVLHLGDDRVRIDGRVVHGQPGVGYALCFVDISAKASSRLADFLADAARRARSG